MKIFNQSKPRAGWLAAAALLLSSAAWASEYQGFVKVEHFDNVNGGAVQDLRNSAKFQANQPDSVTFANSLYYSRSPGVDNYGARISGYLKPTETAQYVFFVAADDSTSFYLSTDSSPANLKLVAADQGWQNSRTWTGAGGVNDNATVGTVNAVFRRGTNPGPEVMQQNGFQWVGPFENRSDQFLNSPRANLATEAERWPTRDANGNAVITLQADQKYYFELLYKEGSGGENAGVTWKKVGDQDPDNGSPEIGGEFLSVEWPDQVTIRTHPQSQTAPAGQIVNFTVDALGVPGDTDTTQWVYQWFVNNEPITDGTGNAATYTIPTTALSDNGKKYKVTVTTATGLTATSNEATLSVVTDNDPPQMTRIRTSDSFDSAIITFSEPVRNEAADPGNYSVTGGLQILDANFLIAVQDPFIPEDPKNPVNPLNRMGVILTTSTQTEGATYDLTLNNVKDQVGNDLSPKTRKMYANVFQPGILNYKRWMGGNNIDTLVADPLRFANPTVAETRTVAETGGETVTYVPGVYVDRLNGFFVPTVTSNYVFYISADNDGYLFLSTDADPANRKLIAADVGWQNARQWTGPGGDEAKRRGDGIGGGPFENRSDQLLTSARAIDGRGRLAGLIPSDGVDPEPWPNVDANGNAVITLQAGQRYAFELWHVEGDSGRAEANFKYATEQDPANDTLSRINSQFIGAYVDPSGQPPRITTQPVNASFTAGAPLNFSVVANSALPATYQWFRNGTAIAGATSSTLAINSAAESDIGSYYVTISNENGTVTSSTVAALPNVVPPGLTFRQDAGGTVVIEAENYFASRGGSAGHLWIPLSSRAGFSGAGYMTAVPDSGLNIGTGFEPIAARLDYKVVFSKAGTHYIWLRGGDPRGDGAGDSVHAGINGASAASATRIDGTPGFNIATGWNWVGNIQGDTRATIEVPSAGEHTVNIWMREDGFHLDKLILTTDQAFTPTGTGPAESERVTGGGATVSISLNASGAPVITYTGTLESSATVNGTYTPVQGASGGSYTVDTAAGGSHRFYRSVN